ncbi:hypothetical protein HU830_03740 [Lactobacillus sp. DCY120]|uniref:Uncharacterized protein n=1 Tax=Bombilactobacillus apium TaxID=2675299 RepID=A0A850QZS0_9LACO|nr:hypothetical protein [Bombilactobacillus apium]NVY96289.1 hypothetical protein [Bombilactobacillus apium]
MTISTLWMGDGGQKLSLPTLIFITTSALTIFASTFVYWKNPVLMLASIILAAYPLGKINPQLHSEIFVQADTQHLSSTIAIFKTLLLIGAPLGNTLFLTIVNLLSPTKSWLF